MKPIISINDLAIRVSLIFSYTITMDLEKTPIPYKIISPYDKSKRIFILLNDIEKLKIRKNYKERHIELLGNFSNSFVSKSSQSNKSKPPHHFLNKGPTEFTFFDRIYHFIIFTSFFVFSKHLENNI